LATKKPENTIFLPFWGEKKKTKLIPEKTLDDKEP